MSPGRKVHTPSTSRRKSKPLHNQQPHKDILLRNSDSCSRSLFFLKVCSIQPVFPKRAQLTYTLQNLPWHTCATISIHSKTALPLKYKEVFVLANKYDTTPPCFKCSFHMFMSPLPYVLLATCLTAVSHDEIFLEMLRYCQLSGLKQTFKCLLLVGTYTDA